MRNNRFISVVMVVALCFGQLASNTHVLSHLGSPVLVGDHGEAGHVHHDQRVLRAKAIVVDKTVEEPGDEAFDCAIYHVFAGSNGLLATGGVLVAALFECVEATSIPGVPVLAGISGNTYIRGPPQPS